MPTPAIATSPFDSHDNEWESTGLGAGPEILPALMLSATGIRKALRAPQLPADLSLNFNFMADVIPASTLVTPAAPGTPISVFQRPLFDDPAREHHRRSHTLQEDEESDMGYQEPDSPSLREWRAVKRKRLDAFSKRVQARGERQLDRALTPDEEGSLAGRGIQVGPEKPAAVGSGAFGGGRGGKGGSGGKAKAKAEAEAQAKRMRIKNEAMVERARGVKEDEERRLREAEQHRLFNIEVQEGVLLNVAFQRAQEEMMAGQRRIQVVDRELEEFLVRLILTNPNLLQKVDVDILPGVLTSLAQSEEGRVGFARHATNEKGLHTYPNAAKVLRALIRKKIRPLLLKKKSQELEKVIQEVQCSASAVIQQADRPDHRYRHTNAPQHDPAGFELAFPAVVLSAMHSAEAMQILSRQTETIEHEDTRQPQQQNLSLVTQIKIARYLQSFADMSALLDLEGDASRPQEAWLWCISHSDNMGKLSATF
ncbi:hypothetical protein FRB98_003376 [Tulasnella sp. 332]|nr:hypothetical protein FRB98_003376 [Tulasnella sp. 332]